MRRTYLLSLFALLWGCLSPLVAQTAAGWVLYDELDNEQVGPAEIPLDLPEKTKVLRQHDFSVVAGTHIGGTYYIYTYRAAPGGSQPIAWGTYDFATGKFTRLADFSTMKTLFYDLTYDYKSKTLYALGEKAGGRSLLRVDPQTGHATQVRLLDRKFLTLAAAPDGKLYGVDEYGELYQIDPNGEEQIIGSSDFFCKDEPQSMCFDHATGRLYWVSGSEREGTQVIELDPRSGSIIEQKELPHDRQVVGLSIPHIVVLAGAPAPVSSLQIQPKSPGSQEVTISFVTPTKRVDGSPLGASVVTLKRGDQAIFSKKIEGKIAETLQFEETLASDALYSYSVSVRNDEGESEAVTQQLFIGVDLPAAVIALQVERQKEGTAAHIRWQAPQKGINGGYIAPGLKYRLVRYPDQKVLIEETAATEFTDEPIESIRLYHYEITPMGKGEGEKAMTAPIILGRSLALPYVSTFTDEEFALWQVIDRNKDGTTWKRTMLKSGISCSYSDKQNGDDWLLSQPVDLKAGVRYKLSIEAASYSEELPEKLNLYLGTGQPSTDESQLKTIAKLIISNKEEGRAIYNQYFVPTEEKLHFLALQMASDPDKFQLNLYRLQLQEAGEGSVSGRVTAEGKALSGAKVVLEGTDFTTVTDNQGVYTLRHVAENDYYLSVQAGGYARYRAPINVVREQMTLHDVALQPLQYVSVTGKVTDEQGKPLDKAEVIATAKDEQIGEECFSAFSNEQGLFTLPKIWAGHYRFSVARRGMHTLSQELAISDPGQELGSFQLKARAIRPRMVAVDTLGGVAKISWQQPIDFDTRSYYKGEGVARIGVFESTSNSIVGTVFRGDVALTAIRWQTDSHQGPHKAVDVLVISLDEHGEPTREILYEAKAVPNYDEQWVTHYLPQPLVAQHGVLVALRYNGYLSLRADAGTNEGLPFERHVHLICKDHASAPYEYLDQHNLEKNLLLAIETTSLDEQRQPIPTLQKHTGYKVYRARMSDHPEWTLLATTGASVLKAEDKDFGQQKMGYYIYAVESILGDQEVSEKALSLPLPKDVEAKLKITLTANAPTGQAQLKVQLLHATNPKLSHELSTTSDQPIMFTGLARDKYLLVVQVDGFERVERELNLAGETAQFEEKIVLKELLTPAFNLQVKQAKEGTWRLTWNTENYYFDNFDAHSAFALEPATTECNWVYWDGDKKPTVEFDNMEFLHMGEQMSFIVFNPYATNPAIAFFDPASKPFSGEQYLAGFGARDAANKDFIFSPILDFHAEATLSAKVRSFTNQLAPATLRVGYCRVEYPKTEADIIWLSDPIQLSDQAWQELLSAVPADAKRMVLLNQSERGFFVMIDDLFVGEETPYADGRLPRPIVQRATYSVKLDGKPLKSDDSKATELQLGPLPKGEHEVEVTAHYASGDAKSKTLRWVAKEISGVETALAKTLYCYPNPVTHSLYLAPSVTRWAIYSLQGVRLVEGTAQQVDCSRLATGEYIVRMEGAGTQLVQKISKQ